MIDARFSRDAFESLRSPGERQQLAQKLGDELREHIAAAPNQENGVSAALARLRLIGHLLFAVTTEGERTVLAGDPSSEEPPTGLELELRRSELVEIGYRSR